ncbi:GrpB family protein [Planctomycetota bacterium]
MAEYDLRRKSSPVILAPYKEAWPGEFESRAAHLRGTLGDLALRIDHIGSTSVPGLAAKDNIDMQITIADVHNADPFIAAMKKGGYVHREGIFEDHVPVGEDPDPAEWSKLYFREPEGARRTHIHVRQQGCKNQQYALLFRDYLRSDKTSAGLYEQLKRRLAELFPESIDSYLYFKDPICDLIMQSARLWADGTD